MHTSISFDARTVLFFAKFSVYPIVLNLTILACVFLIYRWRREKAVLFIAAPTALMLALNVLNFFLLTEILHLDSGLRDKASSVSTVAVAGAHVLEVFGWMWLAWSTWRKKTATVVPDVASVPRSE